MREHVGPQVFEVTQEDLKGYGLSVTPKVIRFRTNHRIDDDADHVRWVDTLCKDEERNNDVLYAVDDLLMDGHSVLVLSDRVEHCNVLQARTKAPSVAVTGEMKSKHRDEVFERMRNGELKVMYATSLADEGLDIPVLSAVVLACPTSNQSKLEQRLGRIMRPVQGKPDPVVVDMFDCGDRAERMWKRRLAVYKKIGCEVRA
jgi:superfamily II DNA or RNA helicase